VSRLGNGERAQSGLADVSRRGLEPLVLPVSQVLDSGSALPAMSVQHSPCVYQMCTRLIFPEELLTSCPRPSVASRRSAASVGR